MTNQELCYKIAQYHLGSLDLIETLEVENLLSTSPAALQDYFLIKRELDSTDISMAPSPGVQLAIEKALFPTPISEEIPSQKFSFRSWHLGFALAATILLLFSYKLIQPLDTQTNSKIQFHKVDAANTDSASINLL